MNKMKGLIGLAVASCVTVSAFAGLAAGCSGGAGGDADFTIWAPQEEQIILPRMIDAFKEEYPEYADVNFSYKVMGVDDSITQLQKDKSVAADVFMFPSGGITELRSAYLINPIDPSAANVDFSAIYNDAAVESVTMDDNGTERIFGVPLTLNTFFMYYDASCYTEEEVKSLETMMAKDLTPILGEGATNFSMPLRDSWYISSFFLSEKDQLTAPTTTSIECLYNGEYGKKVGEYLIDLISNPRYFDATGSGNDGAEMGKHKLAALCSGTWSASDVASYLGDNYRAAPLPTITIDGEEHRLSPFGDYKAYGINSATKNYELANLVALWLGNETCQAIRFDENGDAPTHVNIQKLNKVQTNVAVNAAIQQELYCTNQPKTTMLTYYWDAVASFGVNLMADGHSIVTKATLQSYLDTMVKDVKHLS